jgi:glycosyltransferase involved in cell wall biosynthesis
MRIAFITAGAAGMYCGSCMRDNTLAAALTRAGHDALLIPTYTPIRTDEEDVSENRIFFGGINVYLQQKSRLFRYTPWLFDRLLDFPRLLRWVSRFAVKTSPAQLGDLTVSMLSGRGGKQRKEVRKLVRWLATDFQPDVVLLTNVLLSGLVPELKERWGGPILATLQGDDIFLEALPPADRARSIELIRRNCDAVDGYFATSQYYADFMAGYLGLPRTRMHVVYPGLNLKGHGSPRTFRDRPPWTIGYFARICPDKGFHNIVEAFQLLRKVPSLARRANGIIPVSSTRERGDPPSLARRANGNPEAPEAPACKLKVSGWLGENHRPYFEAQMKRLADAGLAGDVEYVECPTHSDKVRFIQSLDVLSVPTVYREPKGLYVLEALANGVPVVQPRHGAFPELIAATNGGILVEPGDPSALAEGLACLLNDGPLRRQLGEAGQKSVFSRFTADAMAAETLSVLTHYHQRHHARITQDREAIAS